MSTPPELAVRFRASAIQARSLDELIGLCRGVIADGNVCRPEAEFILNWLTANKSVADTFPANVLYPRLMEMLADGHLDDDEAKELLGMLQQMTGEEGQKGSANLSTSIAFNSPLPRLTFQEQAFCLTGEFAFGPRAEVKARIEFLGGRVAGSVLKRGCIVVVGCMGSEAWMHSTHGRKIEAAVEAREKGLPVAVVPEEHWHHEAERAENGIYRELGRDAEQRVRVRAAIRDLLHSGGKA